MKWRALLAVALLCGVVSGQTVNTTDVIFGDDTKVKLGTGSDAGLWYDGTNVQLDARLVGSGNFILKGDLIPQADSTFDLGSTTVRYAEAYFDIGTITTDLVFDEAADHASTPEAAKGYLWVKSNSPSALVFTDDAGNDWKLTGGGGGSGGSIVYATGTPVDNQIAVWTAADTIEGSSSLVFDGTNLGIGVTPAQKLEIGSADNSDRISVYHNNEDAYMKWSDGDLILMTDEGTDTATTVRLQGKGAGVGGIIIHDQDNAEWLDIYSTNGSSYLSLYGTSPQKLGLYVNLVNILELESSDAVINEGSADVDFRVESDIMAAIFKVDAGSNFVEIGSGATEGQTPELKVTGWKSGGATDTLEIGVGTDVSQWASYDGVLGHRLTGATHVFRSSTGATADANADDLVVENGLGVQTGLSIISTDATVSQVYLGSPSDTSGMYTRWDYTNLKGSIHTTVTNSVLTFGTHTGGEDMRINAAGQVGIGTSAPATTLDINAAAGGKIQLTYNDSDGSAADYATLATDSTGALILGTDTGTTALTIDSTQNATFAKKVVTTAGAIATTPSSTTLGVGATTFAVATNVFTVTGDGGGNTVATITGGTSGQLLTLIFVDGLVTITDTDAHTANTVDLSAAFTSADDTVLQLVFDGTSWYEVSRSVN